MMISSQRNLPAGRQGKIGTSSLQARAKIVIWTIVIVLLLIVLNFFNQGVKNFFYTISNPIQRFLWQGANNIADFFGGSLKMEISELRLKNQELLNQVSLLNDLEKENQTLREALEINLQKDFKMILVQIIFKDISEDSILIDKGSNDGISKDMPVINQQKVLFGKVNEVYRNFSKVVLITEKNCAFDAKTQEKEIYGVVRGKGNLSFYFDLISKDAEIKEGDILITSGLGGNFPKNLLVGKIRKVKKEDTKPFQTADVMPFFDLEKTDNLFVITNFKN